MSLGNWLLGRLTKKLLPIIEQTYTVANTIDITIKEILKKLPEAGIPHGTTVYENIKTLSGAIFVIKAALIKIIIFMGGIIPNTTKEYTTLNDEVEKLKDML
jgi:hypothetical protein